MIFMDKVGLEAGVINHVRSDNKEALPKERNQKSKKAQRYEKKKTTICISS